MNLACWLCTFSLNLFTVADRDRHDRELREAIQNFWPHLNDEKLQLLVPPDSGKHSNPTRPNFEFEESPGKTFLWLLSVSRSFPTELIGEKLTVGKIYAALLIYETWREYKGWRGHWTRAQIIKKSVGADFSRNSLNSLIVKKYEHLINVLFT